MLANLMLLLALAAPPRDPVAAALESFRQVVSYRVTMRAQSEGSSEIVRYFYKKPGFVRMEFIKPHKGAVLVYIPDKKKARLRPFSYLKPLVLTLDPDSGMITSPTGHRVDASDLGAFLETAKKLAEHGKSRITGSAMVGKREVLLVEVRGEEGVTVNGAIHRYLLWLDPQTMLPLRTQAFDAGDKPVEDVVMDDLEINVDLADSLFDL